MPKKNNITRFTETILRFRWLVMLIAIGLTMWAGNGAQYLGFTSDYRVWFADDNPQRVAFEKLQDTYTRNDNIMFVVRPKTGGTVFTPNTLAAVQEITEAGWQIPFSIRVDSITNYQHTFAEGDDLTVIDLVEADPTTLTAEELAEKQAIATSEPTLANRLISKNADITAINVTTQLPQIDALESPQVMNFSRDIIYGSVDETTGERSGGLAAKYPQLDIALVGMVPLNVAFMEASMSDMATLTPLMYLIILIFTALMLRSFSATIATLVVIAASTVTAMGIAGWMGIMLTPPSGIAPTIILTLAVADSIHILVSMLKEMRQGRTKPDAIKEALRLNFYPVFLTSITTVIGFLSLNFTEAPPFHDLANMAAIGVTAAFLYSVVLLPAVMMVLPTRQRTQRAEGWTSKAISMLAEFVIRRRVPLLIGMNGLVIVMALLIPRIELNDKFIEYFDHSVQFRVDSDFVSDNLTGQYIIEFSLESGEQEGLSDPQFLQGVERFSQWLNEDPAVDHVLTISDTFNRLNKNMHGDDDAYYQLPADKNLAAQYLLLYEFSLPYGLDLNNQVDVQKSATRVTVTLKNISTREFREFNNRAGDWLQQHHIQSDGGTGPTLMFSYISERNINGMLIGTTLSLIVISGLLIFALKSWKIGLISLVPNLIPAVIAFGIWAIFVAEIGMGVSMVIAMCLGIIVDDTVHFLSKYMRGLREKGLDAEDAVRYAFANSGQAILVTSIIVVAGFLVLSLSPFKVNSHMGLLNSIVVASAVFADFLLLPPLLIALCKKWHKKG